MEEEWVVEKAEVMEAETAVEATYKGLCLLVCY